MTQNVNTEDSHANEGINVFNYVDYREYLRDAFKSLKKRSPAFSQRNIAQKIGVASTGWISDLLAGRRNLSSTQTVHLGGLLKLNPREQVYFETLVGYNQSASIEEKSRYYEILLTFREISADLIDKDKFEYFGEWYHSAIRERLLVERFRGDYAKLAATMEPPITQEQAKHSIELLCNLGMISFDKVNGEYRPLSVHVKKQSGFDQIHYFRYLKANMQLGSESLVRIPKDERYMSALCTALSQESFEEIAEDFRALRRKISILSERDARQHRVTKSQINNRVYQCLIELFPLTQTLEQA